MNFPPIPGFFKKITSRVDHSWDFTFETQELHEAALSEIVRHKGKNGFLLFVPDGEKLDTDNLDLPEKTPSPRKEKTASQRLRWAIERWWEVSGSVGDCEAFYQLEMSKIIEHYRDKCLDR